MDLPGGLSVFSDPFLNCWRCVFVLSCVLSQLLLLLLMFSSSATAVLLCCARELLFFLSALSLSRLLFTHTKADLRL